LATTVEDAPRAEMRCRRHGTTEVLGWPPGPRLFIPLRYQTFTVLTMTRFRIPLLLLAGVAGCHFGPRLSPLLTGCYQVQLDSLPSVYRANNVPPLPDVVRLDTANGGEMHVPVRWLEGQGRHMRMGWLQLNRAGWRLDGGRAVFETRPGWLPADSLVLGFTGGFTALTAAFSAASTEVMPGMAVMWPNPTVEPPPPIPIRLVRTATCGDTRWGMSR
jgi:hypothetical protein